MNDEQKYRKLLVYENATTLVVHVYKLLKKFPKEEQYALCDQLRRAVVSIPSNIAEGVGRISNKDRAHFIEIAYGSLLEVNCQMDVAKRLGYISDEELTNLDQECLELARMLSGLRSSILRDNSKLSALDS
jgi:four helix bundle protein